MMLLTKVIRTKEGYSAICSTAETADGANSLELAIKDSKVKGYEIVLVKDHFFAGEVVTGIVKFTPTATMHCQSIRLQLDGRGYCSVTISTGHQRVVSSNSCQYVTGNITVCEYQTFEAGLTQSIPFNFPLPTQLPSSFMKSDNCHIMYRISCQLAIADVSAPLVNTCILRVLQPLSASTFAGYLQPFVVISDDMSAFANLNCCFPSRFISIRCSTNRFAYASRELVNFSIQFNGSWNISMRHIRSVSVGVLLQVRYGTEETQQGFSRNVLGPINLPIQQFEASKRRIDSCFVLPDLSPSYSGGLSKVTREPVTWRYVVQFQVMVQAPGRWYPTKFACRVPILIVSMPSDGGPVAP